MFTLQIQHAITNLAAWHAAFDRFAEIRAEKGVRSHVVRQPIDDPQFIVVDLEFEESAAAEAFEAFLRTRVWSDPISSPALVGAPMTRILETRTAG
jgi:hypothetical protein